MSDLFGNHIVGFPTRWLLYWLFPIWVKACHRVGLWLRLHNGHCLLLNFGSGYFAGPSKIAPRSYFARPGKIDPRGYFAGHGKIAILDL